MILFRKFICTACGHEWELPQNIGKNNEICPACGREKVHRVDAGIRRQGLRATGRQTKPAGDAEVFGPIS
jgi:predicted RNA-binding Zn-ribbon protein involved in translation (DUF1610 family)